ncbi:helix-turn-helix domain-containing protein [Arthrobacter dokdonensis]|uniref:helix-turn-helix domain-containing protein n=1 Tax=Arthrobacter dokdonellae TaxID=2211210 RepID=UPI000DE57C5E|nr:helix-turn-helix domain-containing protein [Arthrobacter dokdonellae]
MSQPAVSKQEIGFGGELHTVQQLAARYGIPVQTVYVWRMQHKGPRSMKLGKRVFYRMEDILAWEESNLEPKSA